MSALPSEPFDERDEVGTEEAARERTRQKRLQSATGIAYPTGYWVFRGLIMRVARLFVRIELNGARNIPDGINFRPWYRRNGDQPTGGTSFVIAGTHRTVWDIVAMGQIRRGMIWLCKPSFCYPHAAGWLCRRMGAVPFFRYGMDDRRDKFSDRKIQGMLDGSYHTMGELEPVVLKAMALGHPLEIFPEARRKPGATVVEDVKSGAATFARLADAPLIPLATVGAGQNDPQVFVHYRTGRVWSRKSAPRRFERLTWRRLLSIDIGPPVQAPGVYPSDAPAVCDAQMMQTWTQDVTACAARAATRLDEISAASFWSA